MQFFIAWCIKKGEGGVKTSKWRSSPNTSLARISKRLQFEQYITLTFASLFLKWDLTNINFMTCRIGEIFLFDFLPISENCLYLWCYWMLRREILLLNLRLTIWQMKHLLTMQRCKDQSLHQKARRLIEGKIILQKDGHLTKLRHCYYNARSYLHSWNGRDSKRSWLSSQTLNSIAFWNVEKQKLPAFQNWFYWLVSAR